MGWATAVAMDGYAIAAVDSRLFPDFFQSGDGIGALAVCLFMAEKRGRSPAAKKAHRSPPIDLHLAHFALMQAQIERSQGRGWITALLSS